MNTKEIPIIDLFAGPGGLGEGFTSLADKNSNRFFKIALSIEMDEFAHQTLTLRSFLRQFPFKKFPYEYYEYVRGSIERDKLYELYPKEAEKAHHEAWQFKLGSAEDHDLVDKRIKESLNGEKNFVLIGGPPCQAYSLVGRSRRQEGKGLNKEDERVYLYREYYRILAVHQPAIFVMENVKGILSSKVENESIFHQILQDLESPVDAYRKLHGKKKLPDSKHGYKIYSLVKKPYKVNLFEEEGFESKDYIIQAENHGIPQTRHRVILLGIRDDISVTPSILDFKKDFIPVEKVLSGLPSLRSALSKATDSKQHWKAALQEIKKIGLKTQIQAEVWKKMVDTVDKITVPRKDYGDDFLEAEIDIAYKPEWYLDKKLKGVCNHQSRSHIKEDLYRYLFVSCFGRVNGKSPKLSDFPSLLLPQHKNVNKGIEENKFADRFRVQLAGEPSKTVTSHISKDGHYFIHPDPAQCRSLTVREAARIQTFPDNYYFCGPRTEQFHQVGNAVPPLLAYQIAELIKSAITKD